MSFSCSAQGLSCAGRLEISKSRKGETTQPARHSQHLQLFRPRNLRLLFCQSKLQQPRRLKRFQLKIIRWRPLRSKPRSLRPHPWHLSAQRQPSPLDIPFIQLSPIQIDNQDRYVVDFEVLNLDKTARGDRAHFYFNTAPLTVSGVPQEGFYSIFTEAPPYMGLKTTARDRSAVELCVLVAHFDGNMIPGSGTCRPLPDVNSITSNSETICRYGPGEEYPEIRTINFGHSALVEGLSPDESWWFVRNPAEKTETCWVSNATTTFNGDITRAEHGSTSPCPHGNGNWFRSIRGNQANNSRRPGSLCR